MRFLRGYLLSFALSMGVIAIMFFGLELINAVPASGTSFDMRAINVLLAPGIGIWRLSNWICPPFGERCFLGSDSQGAHHLWGLICYVTGWQVVFGIAIAWRSLRSASRVNLE